MACLSSPGASKWAAPRVARPRDALGLGRGQPFYTASASRRFDPDTDPSANATTRTTATTTMSQQPMPPVPIIPPYEHEAPQPQFLPSQQYHHHHHHHHQEQYQQYQQYQPQHREHHQQQYQHRRQQHVAVPVEADPYLVGSREIHPYEHDEVEIQHHHHDYHPYNNSQHAYDTQDHHNHYVVRTPNVKGRHHHTAAATAKMFAPMKSPMSQCIDTIIGAGTWSWVRIIRSCVFLHIVWRDVNVTWGTKTRVFLYPFVGIVVLQLSLTLPLLSLSPTHTFEPSNNSGNC